MNRTIDLTQGKVAIVEDADYQFLSQFKWYADRSGRNWYAKRNSPTIDGKRCGVKMHIEIMGYLKGVEIDHINGDGLDNRRTNLRHATHEQNCANQRKHTRKSLSSRFKGVGWNNRLKKWIAQFGDRHIGCFVSEIDAAKAYDEKAIQRFGPYARTNF